jgi:hypothetical protein
VLEAYSPLGFDGQYTTQSGSIVESSTYTPVEMMQDWNAWRFFFSSETSRPDHTRDPGFVNGLWKDQYDDAAWKTVRWGAYWQEDPGVAKKGFGWYRARVLIPGAMRGKALRLNLGQVAEHDWSYLNGVPVGETDRADRRRGYIIAPSGAVYRTIRWDQENTIAVQVFSAGETGGISSGPYGGTWRAKATRRNAAPRPRIEALGSAKRTANFVVVSDREAGQNASMDNIEQLQQRMQRNWELGSSSGSGAAGLLFLDLHPENYRFRAQYRQISKRINEVLWDVRTGMYLNRLWPEEGGQISYYKSPVMF